MKKFLIAGLVLISSSLFASEEVTIMETVMRDIDPARSSVDARFYMDKKTGEGFAQVTVNEERLVWETRYDGHRHWPVRVFRPVAVLQDSVKIDGLVLVDDKIVYHAAEGDVYCGKLGVSRVLRKPTIYLSGKCSLTGGVLAAEDSTKIFVTFKANL